MNGIKRHSEFSFVAEFFLISILGQPMAKMSNEAESRDSLPAQRLPVHM